MILVTGALGFIGRWLTVELLDAHHDVVGIDRRDGDLTNPATVASVLNKYQPDTVVHLAATPSVLYCEENPEEAIHNNVGMSAALARECGKRGIKLVYASTSEVYGDRMDSDQPCTEDEPVGTPKNLYAFTKLWGEQACRFYAPKDLLVLRISMPYGPFSETSTSRRRPEHRMAVVNFLYAALYRRPITVHAGSERSLCFIADTVRAIRMLLEQGQTGIYNVGRDHDVRSMLSIARMACRLAGAPEELIQLVEPPDYRTGIKNLSMRKIRSLGWRPEVPLEEGMRRKLEWVKTLPGPDSR